MGVGRNLLSLRTFPTLVKGSQRALPSLTHPRKSRSTGQRRVGRDLSSHPWDSCRRDPDSFLGSVPELLISLMSLPQDEGYPFHSCRRGHNCWVPRSLTSQEDQYFVPFKRFGRYEIKGRTSIYSYLSRRRHPNLLCYLRFSRCVSLDFCPVVDTKDKRGNH